MNRRSETGPTTEEDRPDWRTCATLRANVEKLRDAAERTGHMPLRPPNSSGVRALAAAAIRRLMSRSERPGQKTVDSTEGTAGVHWCRVVMNSETRTFVDSLHKAELDVLEISGAAWSDSRLRFRSYRNLFFPEYDICGAPFGACICDLLIMEQVLEHVRLPDRALRNGFEMLRPGGLVMVTTPFLLKFHPCPLDLYRWTEDGMRVLLEEAGFTDVMTRSWGNRECLIADMTPDMEWTYYEPGRHSLLNEPQFPVVVWAFAQKPIEHSTERNA